jgi:hypothetical protein
MINEKPNNNIDWKDKLDELESLAGEKFNKEVSWEKLHARLQSKPKTKKMIWYWLAAACLFFGLFISIFLSNKKEFFLVKNNFLKKKINSPSSQKTLTINKDTSAVISSLSTTENKILVHSIKDIDKINTNINHKTIRTEIVQNKKEENITRQLNNNAVMPVDTAISIVANLPQKKKLKVVHINELGDPVSEISNIARYSEHHSFEFKLINQEGYTGSPGNSHITGFNIFKTKATPSN